MAREEGLIIKLKISPNASKNEIIRTEDGVKVKITAQPIDGKANKCLVEFLSKTFKVPKSSIEIVKGETSKEKTLLIKVFDNDKINFINSVLH
ncbi:YggU family protein [Spirochaetes bacterium]|uniref:UPF0235 protein IAC76_08855 n=1 Tax=Candidatus Scatousia excrementipullorum TaxID=2840936 RepID=A0A9D9H0W7_9BACT|nr:YggU family protein [Candidatus Scatousia excrementipullorum]